MGCANINARLAREVIFYEISSAEQKWLFVLSFDIYEPRHEITCLLHMRNKGADQISAFVFAS